MAFSAQYSPSYLTPFQVPPVGHKDEATPVRAWDFPAMDDDKNRGYVEPGSVYTQNRTTPSPGPQEYLEPTKQYGPWEWDSEAGDYVRTAQDGGEKQFYTDYQTRAQALDTSCYTPNPETGEAETQAKRTSLMPRTASLPRPVQSPLPEIPSWEEPLGAEFQVVAKPKRFFCPGRIFATVWFEPGTADLLQQQQQQPGPLAWSSACPAFHSSKPVARFRWFVVVRRRLHHSLCFRITTYGGRSASKTNRGRAGDFVVLHRAGVDPVPPSEGEEITREAIAVIIEDEEHYISPFARLDCGRIYTVEDNLRVAKIGRVQTPSLPLLEGYYRDSVL